MAEAARGSASRAELLELRREHEVVEEGHRLLDERRVLLARELLSRLRDFDERHAAFAEREREAHAALIEATDRMGLEQLQVYPPLDLSALETVRETVKFIGVSFPSVGLEHLPEPERARPPVFEIEAADTAAKKFAGLLEEALGLASDIAQLLKLEAEYRRTQRRVRALEKILLPELEAEQKVLENALEELEIEEAVRVRLAAKKG
ncbi:MAG: V-type ATP synthase subunit D [Wenzhouxiangellaceae bacterium]